MFLFIADLLSQTPQLRYQTGRYTDTLKRTLTHLSWPHTISRYDDLSENLRSIGGFINFSGVQDAAHQFAAGSADNRYVVEAACTMLYAGRLQEVMPTSNLYDGNKNTVHHNKAGEEGQSRNPSER